MPQKPFVSYFTPKKRLYKKRKLSIDTPTCQESKDLRPPGETPCLGGPLPPRSSYFWIWALWLSHTPALRRGGGDPQDKGFRVPDCNGNMDTRLGYFCVSPFYKSNLEKSDCILKFCARRGQPAASPAPCSRR